MIKILLDTIKSKKITNAGTEGDVLHVFVVFQDAEGKQITLRDNKQAIASSSVNGKPELGVVLDRLFDVVKEELKILLK